MPNNIAVIGDHDFIAGFKALGCELYPVDDKTDLHSMFTNLIKQDFSFIFILETFALKIMDLIEGHNQDVRPLIIPLSDFRQDLLLSENLLSRLTIKAVGKDII